MISLRARAWRHMPLRDIARHWLLRRCRRSTFFFFFYSLMIMLEWCRPADERFRFFTILPRAASYLRCCFDYAAVSQLYYDSLPWHAGLLFTSDSDISPSATLLPRHYAFSATYHAIRRHADDFTPYSREGCWDADDIDIFCQRDAILIRCWWWWCAMMPMGVSWYWCHIWWYAIFISMLIRNQHFSMRDADVTPRRIWAYW